MTPATDPRAEQLTATPEGYTYAFSAMASPCEVRLDGVSEAAARSLGRLVSAEAWRIERKYSRYRHDSELMRINRSFGASVEVDAETDALLDYAAHCFRLSDGLFDITSGVLRKVWRFDGSDRLPSPSQVKEVLPFVGFDQLRRRRGAITVPTGMEIDLGGIGKEYAVDRALQHLTAVHAGPVLVNFGGDLRVSGPRADGGRWRVAIESVEADGGAEGVIEIRDGALTTSGDARRFLLKDGVRYSHILDPRTGWPVRDPPRSITVMAPTCLEAGILSTMAMLQGEQAESFLKQEAVRAWWVR